MNQTYHGENFIFHILEDHGQSLHLGRNQLFIGFSSEYVYPYVSRAELKKLADFIYDYLREKE